LADAQALRRVPDVQHVAPGVTGNAEAEARGRLRRVMVYGTTPALVDAFKLQVKLGQFLPLDDAESARNFVVLGAKLKRELFGVDSPLGARLRVGSLQFRVIGVLEARGQFLGVDLDDVAYIPAARALELFNRDGLMEINLTYAEGASAQKVVAAAKAVLVARHGREDFTLVTQEDMLRTLSNILDVLTMAVAALGSISLLVGGVGIVTIMTIAVAERTAEIGLLVALGARRATVLRLFLGEAIVLSAVGGLLGLAIGIALAQAVRLALPALPVHTPLIFVVLAEVVALVIGLAAGVLPARRASLLDPVEALRAE
jgi:putative ABC transport system permease protein